MAKFKERLKVRAITLFLIILFPVWFTVRTCSVVTVPIIDALVAMATKEVRFDVVKDVFKAFWTGRAL